MSFAELHGRIAGSTRLDEWREDVLTSNVIGLLRYVPLEEGFFPFSAAPTRSVCSEKEAPGEKSLTVELALDTNITTHVEKSLFECPWRRVHAEAHGRP